MAENDEIFNYPAGTPIADMTAEQQSEYWREKAQKHEKQWRTYQDKTDEELRREVSQLRGQAGSASALLKKLGVADEAAAQALIEKRDRADALANDLATDTERAAREAREATEKELRPQLQAQAVEDAFRLLIGDRKTDDEINDFLGDLNLSRFVGENGRVDTAKVLARAGQFAPATGTQQEQPARRGPTATVHGSNNGSAQPGEAGRAAAEARFGKKTQ